MKKSYTILILSYLLFLSSCTKNSNSSGNFFKCTVTTSNGTENINGTSRGVNFDCYLDAPGAVLIGGVGSKSSVDVILHNITQTGTYNFALYSNTTSPYVEIDAETNYTSSNVYNYNPSGSVTVTKVTSNSIEGTFSVKSTSTSNSGSATCTITNGSFSGSY